MGETAGRTDHSAYGVIVPEMEHPSIQFRLLHVQGERRRENSGTSLVGKCSCAGVQCCSRGSDVIDQHVHTIGGHHPVRTDLERVVDIVQTIASL